MKFLPGDIVQLGEDLGHTLPTFCEVIKTYVTDKHNRVDVRNVSLFGAVEEGKYDEDQLMHVGVARMMFKPEKGNVKGKRL